MGGEEGGAARALAPPTTTPSRRCVAPPPCPAPPAAPYGRGRGRGPGPHGRSSPGRSRRRAGRSRGYGRGPGPQGSAKPPARSREEPPGCTPEQRDRTAPGNAEERGQARGEGNGSRGDAPRLGRAGRTGSSVALLLADTSLSAGGSSRQDHPAGATSASGDPGDGPARRVLPAPLPAQRPPRNGELGPLRPRQRKTHGTAAGGREGPLSDLQSGRGQGERRAGGQLLLPAEGTRPRPGPARGKAPRPWGSSRGTGRAQDCGCGRGHPRTGLLPAPGCPGHPRCPAAGRQEPCLERGAAGLASTPGARQKLCSPVSARVGPFGSAPLHRGRAALCYLPALHWPENKAQGPGAPGE